MRKLILQTFYSQETKGSRAEIETREQTDVAQTQVVKENGGKINERVERESISFFILFLVLSYRKL